MIDEHRALDEIRLRETAAGTYTEPESNVNTKFAGHGALFVAKETVGSTTPLCLGLGPSGYRVSFCYFR